MRNSKGIFERYREVHVIDRQAPKGNLESSKQIRKEQELRQKDLKLAFQLMLKNIWKW
jgi:hypothetical protein